jgi:sugar phosphate isomerase/epimerase
MKKISFIAVAFFILLSSSTKKSPSDTPPAPGWDIGLQLWTFRLFSFHDAIAKADSCGIKSVQAFPGQKLGGPWTGNFDPSMTTEQRKAVKDYVKSKGITINAYGVGGADNEESWRKLFVFAKDMGIALIVSEPKDDQWDYVNKLSGEFNIPVAIHDHPRPNHYWNPDSVLLAMKGHPNIGDCADIGHWARSGLNPVDCLKKLSGHILNVHFKDIVTFNKTNAADTIPGKGVIDFHAVLQELKRQNYKGTFSIEHESNWENNAGDVIEIVKFFHQQVNALK